VTDNLENLKELCSGRSLLIVEDDEKIRDIISDVFKLFFKKIDVANDGEEGLEKITNNDYDLIVSDITMPKKNGIEMIKDACKVKKNLRIVVLSAHSDAEYLMPLIDMGVEKFISKPFDIYIMIDVFKKIIETVIFDEIIEKQNTKILELNKYLKRKNKELEVLSSTLESIVYDESFDISKFREAAKFREQHQPKKIEDDTIVELWN
jgi:putative two-component system response regulator